MSLNLLIMLGGGLGLLLLVAGVVSAFVGKRSVVEERLGRYAEAGAIATGLADTQEELERSSPLSDFFNRLGEGTDLFDSISRSLARADIKFRPAEYLTLIIGLAVIGGIIGMVSSGGSVLFAIIFLFVGAFIPHFYVLAAQRRRLKMFDNQLGDMLNLMVNGIRAGFSTLQAMEAVSRELPSPISDEFHRVVQEMQLGIQMEDALNHLTRRINSDDLDLVITAISIQREVGGNLAEILDVISYTIRERVRIKGQIAAITAQGRATAWVIAALPIVLVLLLFMLNREYMMTMFNPETRGCGIPIMVLAGIMVISGFFAVQKIVQIDI
jgi:tight adherence protein B